MPNTGCTTVLGWAVAQFHWLWRPRRLATMAHPASAGTLLTATGSRWLCVLPPDLPTDGGR